jgi:replication factor C subunit 1
MNIAITGNYDLSKINYKTSSEYDNNSNNTNNSLSENETKQQIILHKILRPGYKLYIGSTCNDGRSITESWRYKQAIKLGIPIVRKKPSIVSTESVESKMLLVDKYAPKNVGDIIGNKEQIKQITNWLEIWNSGSIPEMRGLIISGPPGIGKTSTVHILAKSLGYAVTEYNASDARSVSILRGLFALGVKRLIKEVIVMDEVDGLSERGGVGEIAGIIRQSVTPIICISNEKPPKLRPIINSCIDIKFNRPVKSTIASALLKITVAEKINITKNELEELCEKNGNDIRSIINNLEFYKNNTSVSNNMKDATLRLDMFSATQRLIGNKKIDFNEASNLVYVDYNMIPLMIQEAYPASSKNSLEDTIKASEFISTGDIIGKRIHQKHDWSLLPQYVQATVSAARTVTGYAPFQIFPQWLGKNSKRLKHCRYMDELSSKFRCSNDVLRMDYAAPLQSILLGGITEDKKTIQTAIQRMDNMNITRDDIMENLQEVLYDKLELSSKIKTAFTREYNKGHLKKTGKKESAPKKRRLNDDLVSDSASDVASDSDADSDINELDAELNTMEL